MIIPPPIRVPVTFWTQELIYRYSNVLTAFQTYNFEGNKIIDNNKLSLQDLTTKSQFLKKKYSDIKKTLINEANKEYGERQRSGEIMENEEYSDIMLQINYDIAW